MKGNIARLALAIAIGLSAGAGASVGDNPWEAKDWEARVSSPDSAVLESNHWYDMHDRELNIKASDPSLAGPSSSSQRDYAKPDKSSKKSAAADFGGGDSPAQARKTVSHDAAPAGGAKAYPGKSAPRRAYLPGAYDDELTEQELASIDRWQNGIKNVFWEDYRGNSVRGEILRTNQDIKEMRLKFVQTSQMTSDPDGSVTSMLDNVADTIIRRTCGKASRQAIILYERPSVEVTRQTAYDDYRIIARGSSLREYGFRCIY